MENRKDFDRDLEQLTTRQTPMTQEERDRILALAWSKAGLEPAAPQPKTPPARRAAKPLRTVAIAAAAVCALAVTAFAAPALIRMAKGEIGFFRDAPGQSEVDNAVDAPRGEIENARTALEAYNAPVNQSVTDAGVTITLDNICMDAASMDVFFTITGEQAMEGVIDKDEYYPDWYQFCSAGPLFWRGGINGREGAFALDSNDFYRADSATIQLWCHFLLQEVPQGDEVTVTLSTDRALNQKGNWSFAVTLDGAQVRAGARQAAPGVYETGISQVNEINAANVGNYEDYRDLLSHVPLRLEKLVFGPLGGVIRTDFGDLKMDENNTLSGSTVGLSAFDLLLTDDTGKTLPVTYGSSGNGGGDLNVALPDPAATSITITPVRQDIESWEERHYTVEEMKSGVQMPTSSLGGYTVQDYRVEGSSITMKLVPYGWASRNPQLSPDDDGRITMVTSEVQDLDTGETLTAYHSALQSEQVDPQTGVISWRVDYYAATGDELNAIPSWRLFYEGDAELDTAHAVTLPLEPLE